MRRGYVPVSAIATAMPPPTAISAAAASQIRRELGGDAAGAAACICIRALGRGGPTPSWVGGSFGDEACSAGDDTPG